MGEYESKMRYAKSVGADVRKPQLDRRTTSQRVTDEMNEIKDALAEKEAELALNAKMLAKQCDLAREAETKLAELREKVRPLLDWVETRTKPNRQHYYSRCVVCNATWWDKKENHNIRCFVPALRAAVEIRNPPGTSE